MLKGRCSNTLRREAQFSHITQSIQADQLSQFNQPTQLSETSHPLTNEIYPHILQDFFL